MKNKILIIDDDPAIAEMLTLVLKDEGFEAYVVEDGSQVLERFRSINPDLVLLDLMLPGLSGIDVCKRIRTESLAPIIMLTAKTDTVDVVVGLESGADDYIVKPFKSKELIARIRARLRQPPEELSGNYSIGPININTTSHKVTRDDEVISLTPLEFDILVTLAKNPRKVFSRELLLELVWGYKQPADTRLVNVHIQRLRSKVEQDPENPEIVLTIRGIGYRAGPP